MNPSVQPPPPLTRPGLGASLIIAAMAAAIGLLIPGVLRAANEAGVGTEEAGEAPRVWDQQRAVEIVRGMLETEASGQPWDKIEWRTDADDAVAEARREDRPLLVYFYLRKPVGPDDAPC